MENIYLSIYNILEMYIFGGDVATSIYGAFFCEGVATILCAFLVFLPFLIVYRVMRRFL